MVLPASLSSRDSSGSSSSASTSSASGSLARVTSNGSSDVHQHTHPLSPDLSFTSSRSKRSSYFHPPDPSLLVGEGGSSGSDLFKDDGDDGGADKDSEGQSGLAGQLGCAAQHEGDGSNEARTPRLHATLSPGPLSAVRTTRRAEAPSPSPRSVTVSLSRPPHKLAAREVKRQLDSPDVQSQFVPGSGSELEVALLQQLSQELGALEHELSLRTERQERREAALRQLLRDSSTGAQITDGMVDRALVRANAEAAEHAPPVSPKDGQSQTWKRTIQLAPASAPESRPSHSMDRSSNQTRRAPLLDDDLQDAMSENDFGDSAYRSISQPHPATSLQRGGTYKASTHQATSSASPQSPSSTPSNSLHERRTRQASHSISSRLFGGFSPTTSSFVAPSSASFDSSDVTPSSSAFHTASPASTTGVSVQTKPRAGSIHSVNSVSSATSASQKGKTSWTGSLWGWKTGTMSSKQTRPAVSPTRIVDDAIDRMHAGKKEEISGSSGVPAATPEEYVSPAQASSTHGEVPNSDGKRLSIDSRTGRTTPTSVRSAISSPLGTKDDPIAAVRPDGPANILLGRRKVSGLHPDSALTTDVVPTPVSASAAGSSTPGSESSSQTRPTSHAMLQSISSLHSQLDIPDERPSHFRAVSESASTIRKKAGQSSSAPPLYRHPEKVSENVNRWTLQLLSAIGVIPDNAGPRPVSRNGPSPIPLDASASGAEGLATPLSKSRSPRLAAPQNKATLSPATLQSDASGTSTVRLSASSPTEEMPASPLRQANTPEGIEADEAMPLGAKALVKQKGYIASAKGTIGRALGYSSSAQPAAGSKAHPAHSSKDKRRNSLMTAIEPALTLPSAFSTFSSPSSGPPTAQVSSHAPTSLSATSKNASTSFGIVEMGTIVAPDAKPPTLSSDLSDQMKNGPLVDRFGFVYDIKAGMKLLKENRRRQTEKEDDIMSLDGPAPMPDVNVAELAEAIGPSPAPTPDLESALLTATPDLKSPSTPTRKGSGTTIDSKEDVARAPHMSETPSNQSIRRLLNQLGEMNESVEKAQKEAWDAFIKRRKEKAARPKTDEQLAAAAKKKKRMVASADVPMGIGQARTSELDAEVESFTETLVGVANMGSGKTDDKTFRLLVKSGIPIIYRPAIWAEVSGASEIREPGLYQELLAKHAGEKTSCLEQIDMDTHRTFPTNVFFAGNGPGVSKLRRVLIAYSWRDPSIGYCQGMNLLAALLLLVYPDEEDAFWMLSSVLERTLPSDYYSSQLLVSQADQRVLQDLIQLALPDLYAHLEDLGVDLPAVTFGWFLSLFTDALPIQTLLRVWDVLLVYGPISLFKVAIAIFKIHSAEIFAADSASSFYVLLTSLTSHMYSADKLLTTALDDLRFIKRQDVESRRMRHVLDIERELAPLPEGEDV